MKNLISIALLMFVFAGTGFNQTTPVIHDPAPQDQSMGSRIGIIISSNDPETVWNAFRFANFSCQKGDSVSVFLLGKGVEAETLKHKLYDIKGMMESYVNNGGKILACGTCLKSRKADETELCPVSTLNDLYEMVKQSGKLLTF